LRTQGHGKCQPNGQQYSDLSHFRKPLSRSKLRQSLPDLGLDLL
jgi:hypothetical protein